MHKLDYYLNKFKHVPSQGSDDWLLGRQHCFGGSEMGATLNRSKFETFESMVKKKKTKKSDRNDNTEWGHLFEPVAKKFISQKLERKIYEFGSIPHPYYPVCYSPDGLLLNEDNSDLVLLEIKNPICRKPVQEAVKIKEEYLLQIQTGMDIMSVQYCLFVEFKFRRCSFRTKPETNSFDHHYHHDYYKNIKPYERTPKSWGYLYWPTDEKLVDLGSMDTMIETLMELEAKRIRPLIMIETPFKEKKGVVLMWKLFDATYHKISPAKDFLRSHEQMLWKQYKLLIEALKENDPETKEEDEISPPCAVVELEEFWSKFKMSVSVN